MPNGMIGSEMEVVPTDDDFYFDFDDDDALGELSGPMEGIRGFQPLNEIQVKSAVSREILDSHGTISSGSQVSEERRRALRSYYGKPLGNEVEGRSQVVMTDVADTIHWLMPSLMRIFTSGEDIFQYRPNNEKDEEGAKQATLFINNVFWNELDGARLIYDWMFDALLEKSGTLIVYFDVRSQPKREHYYGMSAEQLEALQDDGRGLEVVEFEQRMIEINGEEVPVFDMTLMETNPVGRIVVEGIPPEEFMIARRTIKLDDDTPFAGQRKKMIASDLIAMGFDPREVERWPTDVSPEFSQGRTVRLSEEETFPFSTADRPDAASREMWINNCWIRIDEDGDGYAELRHIMCIGDTATELILDEYSNFMPFVDLAMSPIPHKFFGQSVYDLVGDIQVIRTTLVRQMLDNIYLVNNQRMMVVRGQVEMADLLTSRPGGIVRVDDLQSLMPIVQPPLPDVAFQMMQFLDETRELRVGVTKFSQGIDAGSLGSHTSATQTNVMQANGQARIELIARIFADGGFKRLGKLLLRSFVQNDNKRRTVRLNGKWVEVDPSQWNESMDVNIKTALGIGSQSEKIGEIMALIQLQKEALLSGGSNMVTPNDFWRATDSLSNAMGFRGVERFFTQPEPDASWPEPPPDPKILENKRRVQDDQAKNQLKAMELENQRIDDARLAQHRDDELAQDMELAVMEKATRELVARIQQQGDAGNGEEAGD